MKLHIHDGQIINEALTIMKDVYNSEQLEKVIMKLLRHYKLHTDSGNGGWYEITKYANARYAKEKDYGNVKKV